MKDATTALQLHTSDKGFTTDQIALIKSTVAKGTTNDELSLFLYTAKRTGLDPLMKQIHAIKRFSKKEGREVMSIQTGIDGLRLIADRTDRYAPGPEPIVVEEGGKVISATAYVKKRVGNDWHTIGATAYYEEYVQTFGDGKPMGLWAKMPRLMTAKCAEALALRKAFPAEMSGVYTFDEMTQADSEPTALPTRPVKMVEAEVVDPAGPSPAVETQPPPPPAAPIVPPGARPYESVVPPPAAEPEKKDMHTLINELHQLAEIAREAGLYPTEGKAIRAWTDYKDKKTGESRGYHNVASLKHEWQVTTAIEKANAQLNQKTHPLDEPADDDIPF